MKESTNKIRDYLKSLITKEMSADQLEQHQSMINELDQIDQQEDNLHKEIDDCKDQIVKLVKSQGTATPPQDEPKKPRSLEEIAQAIRGGK